MAGLKYSPAFTLLSSPRFFMMIWCKLIHEKRYMLINSFVIHQQINMKDEMTRTFEEIVQDRLW